MANTEERAPAPAGGVLGRRTLVVMAAGAGAAVANIYYNQPLLPMIGADLRAGAAIGIVPTATQLGYAAGLFLLVPLGDLVERRRLIALQFVLLAVALLAAAAAWNLWSIALASLAVGLAATVAQRIVPFAAHLAHPDRRGSTVGFVMAGLLLGILLSRTIAGFVGTEGGWRLVFALAVPLALVSAAAMRLMLPESRPEQDLSHYRHLGRSLTGLWRRFPDLRRATFAQALLFASFSAFWTILALHLAEPRYALGADVAGLFGIVGAVGILAAPAAGRLADRRGPSLAIVGGAAVTLAAWAIFGLWQSLAGLILGVILLDLGVQSALISHQHRVFSLDPTARSRITTLFMGGMFLGGAAGSAAAGAAWHLGGWNGVVLLGGALAGLALALQRRR